MRFTFASLRSPNFSSTLQNSKKSVVGDSTFDEFNRQFRIFQTAIYIVFFGRLVAIMTFCERWQNVNTRISNKWPTAISNKPQPKCNFCLLSECRAFNWFFFPFNVHKVERDLLNLTLTFCAYCIHRRVQHGAAVSLCAWKLTRLT